MYTCYECNGAINGQFTTVNGRCFHQGCFKCSSCGCGLTNFYTNNGRFLCANCYSEAAMPKCSSCKKSIKMGENYMTVNGKVLHNECFRCEGPCLSPINGRFFMVKNKNICANCYSKYGDNFENFMKPKEEPKKSKPVENKIRIPIYY